MHILAVLSQKGGTGKSHTVRSLAVAGILDGRKVAIIDADPQATVVAWGKRRKHNVPHVIALGRQTIASQVEALKGRGADLIVIDTPPHAQPIINMAADASTACLIVTGAFLEELETVATVANIAKTLKRPSAIALNRVGRSHALTLARTAARYFRPAGVPCGNGTAGDPCLRERGGRDSQRARAGREGGSGSDRCLRVAQEGGLM